MQIIKELSSYIEQELTTAEEYAKSAIKHKNTDVVISNNLIELAEETMQHVDTLHKLIRRLIEEYRSSGNSAPLSMQVVYDYLYEIHVEKANRIKILINQYNES